MKGNSGHHSALNLVVICENFGISYSGGSLATCKLIEHMIDSFNRITILCEQHDGALSERVNIVPITHEQEVLDYLNAVTQPTVLYGDFHKCHYIADYGLPFYFSYHDNWPDMLEHVEDKEEGRDIIDRYRHIFKHANMIFTVSEYKRAFIEESTDRLQLIRNGITQQSSSEEHQERAPYRILMAGNISYRKCHHLPKILHLLSQENRSLKIDLYGNIEDAKLYDEIMSYPIIDHKGYTQELNYGNYDLLLHTSIMENLSLSVVDAIANRTPVVAFDVGGLSEVIQDGVNGHLIPPYDSEAMAKAIINADNHSGNYRFDSDQLAEFDWSKSARKMVETIYKTHSL